MKSTTIILLATGLVSALSIPQHPAHRRGLAIRQDGVNATQPINCGGAEVVVGDDEAAEGEGEEEEEAAVEEGQQEEEVAEGEEQAVEEGQEGEEQAQEDERIVDDMVNDRNDGRVNEQRQRAALLNATRNLISRMQLDGLFNLNGIAQLGINQQISLITQLQQLNQLQQIGLVNQFQLVTLIQQGRLLNNLNVCECTLEYAVLAT